MAVSATLACSKVLKENKNIYNFGLGANPLKQPKFYIEQMRIFAHQKEYTPTSGIDDLKNSIINKYSSQNYQVDNIILGNGLKELLFLVQLAFDGKIYHITPSWVSYKEQIKILNKESELIELQTHLEYEYKINLNYLDAELSRFKSSKKLLIFNNPNNPTGLSYTPEEVEAIAKILKKHNCIVLADEIYLNVHHFSKTQTISDYIPELTIKGTSVSKDLACGGYRLGWITFPKQLEDLYLKCNSFASSIISCPNVPTQYATDKMLNNEIVLNDYFHMTNIIYKYIVDKVDSILKDSNIKFIKPNSGWYIFLNFDNYRDKLKLLNIKNSYDLHSYLLNNLNILTVAGENFNCSGLNLRLSLIDINTDLLYKTEINSQNVLSTLQENPEILDKIKKGLKVLIDFLSN